MLNESNTTGQKCIAFWGRSIFGIAHDTNSVHGYCSFNSKFLALILSLMRSFY